MNLISIEITYNTIFPVKDLNRSNLVSIEYKLNEERRNGYFRLGLTKSERSK